MSVGLVVVEALVPRGLWALAAGHFAEAPLAGRYQRAWTLRIEPGKRACGLTLGEDFSAYSPRGLRTVGEAPYDEFPRRGRLTIRYVEDEDLEILLARAR